MVTSCAAALQPLLRPVIRTAHDVVYSVDSIQLAAYNVHEANRIWDTGNPVWKEEWILHR